ncbi:MAG: hypothetical protein JWM21_954 [Acidobacteria bacterium]|nr:hypothetical protein [Acidobacteriota bacterium]
MVFVGFCFREIDGVEVKIHVRPAFDVSEGTLGVNITDIVSTFLRRNRVGLPSSSNTHGVGNSDAKGGYLRSRSLMDSTATDMSPVFVKHSFAPARRARFANWSVTSSPATMIIGRCSRCGKDRASRIGSSPGVPRGSCSNSSK